MTLSSIRIRTLVATAALAVIAIESAFAAGSPAKPAEAQEYTCEQYRICIEKRTTDRSSVEFPFVIDVENVTNETAPTVGGATISGPGTVYLSHGEEVGLEFRGSATVTELAVSGWRLVDIDCDYSGDFSVRRTGNTIEIGYTLGSPQSYLHCTFINEEIRPQLNLGGLFAGQPTPLPTAPAPAAVAPAPTSPVISPPRTGEAGIK